jgi:VWFA-related protein
MPSFRFIVLLALACLMPASLAAGQTKAPPESAAQSASAPPATVVHANANLVLVDVVVTEKDKAVHGLDKSRFHVFEDGHEQAITSFDEHLPPDPGPASSLPPMKRVALPPDTHTNIPAYPATGAVNVLLLDGLNTPLNDQMNVRLKMIGYMEKIKPGTSLAIFGLTRQLRMIAGFSTDLTALTKALKNPRTTTQPSVLLNSEQGDPVASPSVDTQGTAIVSGGPAPTAISQTSGQDPAVMDVLTLVHIFQAEMTSFQTDQRVLITLDALQQLARYLSAIPGRKNVIWFSGSFPLTIAPENVAEENSSRALRSYSEQVRETIKMLSDARVSLYPIDARGLMVPDQFNASQHPSADSFASTTSAGTSNEQVSQQRTQRVNEQATMQQIAQGTGGKAFVDTNDFTGAVAEVVENGSSYYTIGYVPDRKQFDGQFHKFKVRLEDAPYKLAYRSGYYADSPDKPSPNHPGETSLIVAASRHGAPLATQISFVARVLPASDPLFNGVALTKGPVGDAAATLKGPGHRYVVDLVLDLHGLVFDTLPDGSQKANIEFAMVAYDEDGTRVNYSEHAFQLTFRPDRFDKLMASGVPIRAELDLPEGQGSIRIAIQDLAGGRAGSLEVPVTVAAR